jgi:hypothetical protein
MIPAGVAIPSGINNAGYSRLFFTQIREPSAPPKPKPVFVGGV